VQSDATLALDILTQCPEIFETKYIVMPTFDGCSIVPNHGSQNFELWQSVGSPRIVTGPQEIPWSGNGEEIYSFAYKPDEKTVHLIQSADAAMQYRYDDPALQAFWDAMRKIAPESYFAQGNYFSFATTNERLFNLVMASDALQQLPMRQELEIQQRRLHELESIGPEIGPETCRNSRCQHLRIALGIYCQEHHLAMLKGTVAPNSD